MAQKPAGRRRNPIVYLLLALPTLALIWPPFYAHEDPELAGIPFFYWYQLAWVFLSAILTGAAYWLERRQ
jgi:hypothetical protein